MSSFDTDNTSVRSSVGTSSILLESVDRGSGRRGFLFKKSPHGLGGKKWPLREFILEPGDDFMRYEDEEGNIMGTIRLSALMYTTEPVCVGDKCIFWVASSDGPRTYVLATSCERSTSEARREALLWCELLEERAGIERAEAPPHPERIPFSDLKRNFGPAIAEAGKRQIDRAKEKIPIESPLLERQLSRGSQRNPNDVLISGAELADFGLLEEAQRKGANMNAVKDDRSVLVLALSDFPTVRWLLKNGSSMRVQNKTGQTPAMLAARDGHLESLMEMVEHDRKALAICDKTGRTVYHYARARGPEFVEALPQPEPEHPMKAKYMRALEYWLSIEGAAHPSVEKDFERLSPEVVEQWTAEWPGKAHPLRKELLQLLTARATGLDFDADREMAILGMRKEYLERWTNELLEEHPEFGHIEEAFVGSWQ